jgi:hypothetical protein
MKHSRKAKKAALIILRRNRSGTSYRELGREYKVKAGTLCRFAKSKGEYLPKDKSILKALGLVHPEKPKQPKPDYIIEWDHLPREERHKVIRTYLDFRRQGKK